VGAGGAEHRRLVQVAEGDELIFGMGRRGLQMVCGLLLLWLAVFVATREPRRPALPKWEVEERLLEQTDERTRAQQARAADVALVKGLLRENLSKREFDFQLVIEAVSERRVIPLKGRKGGNRILQAVEGVMAEVLMAMNAGDSPVRGLRRINEASAFFEERLMRGLDGIEGIRCEIPQTRAGVAQRSGYPDLKITDEATGEIYYLDPKLMEQGSVKSSFRTFYFEPKDETLKVTDDATHLLMGIEHDGVVGEWQFLRYRVMDLSGLKVRLKAEFQASNRELYGGLTVLEMAPGAREDGNR
jgi:hypothetical protein